MVAIGASGGIAFPSFLLEDVADHSLGLRAEDVERVGLDIRVRRGLERQQTDLWAVAVGENQVVTCATAARSGAAARTLAAGCPT